MSALSGPSPAASWPATTAAAEGAHPLLLSVDFEDWHQLVRRRLGVSSWEQPGPALPRQTATLLDLLDELEVKATFFVLGITARAHPGLVQEVARRGHEIGCHGHSHQLVHSQTRQEFADDLAEARRTVEELTGKVPIGYRAPAFSITADCPWAHDVLVEQGFAYDASRHDSPRIHQRMAGAGTVPYPVAASAGTLWEFPVAVWRGRLGRLPVGGASYWAVLPTTAILGGLARAGPHAGLYLHPQELDPQRLDPGLPGGAPLGVRARGRWRGLQRNVARRRAGEVLRAIAGRHPLMTYGEAHARLADGPAART